MPLSFAGDATPPARRPSSSTIDTISSASVDAALLQLYHVFASYLRRRAIHRRVDDAASYSSPMPAPRGQLGYEATQSTLIQRHRSRRWMSESHATGLRLSGHVFSSTPRLKSRRRLLFYGHRPVTSSARHAAAYKFQPATRGATIRRVEACRRAAHFRTPRHRH